jgi:DNA-binding ferritin-like protein
LCIAGGQKIKMSKKTLEVVSDMIDEAVDELAKLILRLDNNPKKTRKEQNTIKKIQEIRDTIQDSVLHAKLKKSIE